MEELKQFGVIPVDVAALETVFSSYSFPQKKITTLEQTGKLIRLKRGLYVVAPGVSGRILSEELIANHLYGASYVSMETALRYYGQIPENVYTVTSMTLKLTKYYENSVGKFEYIHCAKNYYSIGIRQVTHEDYAFQLASPEKALCDLIAYTPKLRLRTVKSVRFFLEEDLRFDMDAFYNLDATIFEQCSLVSKKKTDLQNLVKLLKK